MKHKLFILFAVICLMFLVGCKEKQPDNPGNNPGDGDGQGETLEAPVFEMDKDYYVIGETIGFKLDNYDTLEDINITFDTTNGVKVNDDGSITARRVGTYTATLSLKEDSTKSSSVEFSVYKKSFQLDSTTLTIAVGDKAEVWVYDKVGDPTTDVMIRPSKELCQIKVGEELPMTLTGGYDPNEFVWLCDDIEIARVTKYDGELQVTGVGEGKAFITCYNIKDPSNRHKYLVSVEGELIVDYRKRLVELAYEQIGIKEGIDANGEYDNMTKFGIWYGNYGEPWCATFVSWVWYHAGLSNNLLLKYQGCTAGMGWCKEQGIFKTKEEYTPKTGDIVFFQSGSVYNGVSSHTGIVAHCDGAYIYTIEGHRSNRVDVWRLSVDNYTIIGYGVPNYPGLETYDDFAWIKEQQPDGSYLWHAVSNGESTT